MKKRYHQFEKLRKQLSLSRFFLLFLVTIVTNAQGQQSAREISVPNYGKIGYLEYLPDDYNDNNKKYPVLIFLHGAGERGNSIASLEGLKKNGPPKRIESGHPMQFNVNGKTESLIVISPQLWSKYNSWPAFYVDLVIEHIKKTYRVDLDRIYLTGLSMGGGGCWAYTSFKAEYAGKIAAMVPICGHQSFNSSKVCNISQKKVSVWAHHGDADTRTTIRYSRDWVNGINNCSSDKLAELTVYPGVGHSGAWVRAYETDYTYNAPTIYEWMLLQRRSEATVWDTPVTEPENQLPIAEAGNDVNIELPTDSEVTLDGTASLDQDGSIASYAWSQVSGPSTASLTNPLSSTVTVTSFSEGTYTFSLKVTDDEGAEDSDQVVVTVTSEPDPATEPSPSPPPTDDCGCDHTITASQPYVNGENLGVQPGDVVCIEGGNYPYLNLFNFRGSAEQPILFKNCGGQVLIGGSSTNYGIVMNNNQYFRFTGTGDPDYKYGFKVDGQIKYLASGFAIATKSSDFELDHIEITKVEAGVLAKTNPSCDASTWQSNYTMRNVSFHDFYIHGIEGEGFYIGHTSLKVNINCNGSTQEVIPHDIEHIRVYNNVLESTGWDGIQVSRASKDCEIYNNRVIDYGTVNKSSQQAGIIVGGESTGKVYNNWVEGGTGSGIQVFGTGEVDVFNNVIKDAGEDAIFCDDRSPLPVSARFINNTIINPGRDGIRLYNDEGFDNVVCNNLIVSPGSLGDYGNTDRSYLFVLNGVDYAESTNHFASSPNVVNFESFSEGNFQITENSPALDAGTDVGQYGIDEDCLGNARPANSAYDIGAFESLSGSSSEPESDSTEVVKASGLNYRYYEGDWSMLPSFNELSSVKSGQVANFNLSIRERDEHFGVIYEGYIEIPVSGEYTFETASDDGSKLYIGGYDESHLVVNNDGLHGKRFREGTVDLDSGLYPIAVTFFERRGGQVLEVYWKNTASGVVDRQQIPDNVLFSNIEDTTQIPSDTTDVPETTDSTLVAKVYQINITKQGFSSDLSDWFDISLDNISGSKTFDQVTDVEGSVSNISITAYHGVLGSSILGVADNQSSLNNGLLPDAVLRHAAYTTGVGALEIENLDPQNSYTITLLGGRAGSGERFTQYIVNGEAKQLQCVGNNTETVSFQDVLSDDSGKISIKFQQAGNTWAYLNAIVIEEIDLSAVRTDNSEEKVAQRDRETTVLSESIDQELQDVTVFPNPFRSELTVDLGKVNYQSADVTIMDQYGQAIYRVTLNTDTSNSAKLNVDLRSQIIRSGIYIVRVELDHSTTKLFRLVAE